MIAIDELESTLKRISLLVTNTDSPEERAIGKIILGNIGPIVGQLNAFIKTPEFSQQVKTERELSESSKTD